MTRVRRGEARVLFRLLFFFLLHSIPRVLGHITRFRSYISRPTYRCGYARPGPSGFLLVLVNWVNCYHQKSTGPVLVLVTRPEIPVVQIRGIETDGVVQIDALAPLSLSDASM